ncbi:hypothetical protein ACF0H5_000582 [Mactra antiquata]
MSEIPVIKVLEVPESEDKIKHSPEVNKNKVPTLRIDNLGKNPANSDLKINFPRNDEGLNSRNNEHINEKTDNILSVNARQRRLSVRDLKDVIPRAASPGVNRRSSIAVTNILKKFGKSETGDKTGKRYSLDSVTSSRPKLTDVVRKRYPSLRSNQDVGSGLLNAISQVRQRSARPRTPVKPKIPPLVRFRSYGRLALICVRLCKYSHENVAKSQDEYLSIIQVTRDYVTETATTDELYFDPKLYVANKEQRLPVDARRILQKDSKLRTLKDIEYLHLVLRSIKAFADYPNIMQKKLCKEGWYEAYEPKRAIVRQGQPPHAFYFILSGSVVVTSYDIKRGTTFLVSLHKGMSFGELAVITRSRRQATVSTSLPTEFLCISANDFVNIFMSGGIKSITDPEQNSFIRSIPFLKHWPIECLATHPQACMFHYFGRGQVLVRDSNHSDWIYIVKSGSLSVMKKLVEVHPRTKTRREPEIEPDEEGSTDDWGEASSRTKNFGTWNFRIKKKKRLASTGEKELFKNNIEMEKRLEQILPGFYNATERLGLIDYDEIISDHKTRILPSNRKSSTADSLLPTITVQSIDTSNEEKKEDSDTMDTSEEEKAMKLPKIRKTSKGAYLATTKNTKRKTTRKEAIQEEIFMKQLEYDKKAQDKAKIGVKTIADELDNKLIKDFTLTEKDIHPMFVQVQVLERGQYFGLTKNVFPEQSESFSVVSNGAECIMISKKFFFEKANETVMYHLRQVETLLPQEEELQSNLQDFIDWRAHRARVYNRLVKNKHSRRTRHQQFPTQYSGQYCFRTGPTIRID